MGKLQHITTEITSKDIASDIPIHERLFFGYHAASQMIAGDILEIGCGVGRGVEQLMQNATSYTAIDKNEGLIELLSQNYPKGTFIHSSVPPLKELKDNSFDFVITFHVIEHIKDDELFIKEIQRVLKPGGKVVMSTPNLNLRLARNPWHVREYTVSTMKKLLSKAFSDYDIAGITGNEKVKQYYKENKAAVERLTRFDFLNLQYKLPASVLKVPYEILNRMNRNKLMKKNDQLVSNITYKDYELTKDAEQAWDLFVIANK